MNKLSLTLALFAAAAPALANYNPDADRAALRQAATAANDAATRAAAVPLLPERAAEIKADLDQSVVQANSAATSAKNLETGASQRSGEMAGALQGRGEPAPADAAKASSDAASAARAHWKSLSKDQDGLKDRVDALPDGNKERSALRSELSRSAGALSAAGTALNGAETAASAGADAVAAMALAEKRAEDSAAELSAAEGEVVSAAAALPQPVAEAEDATGLLGKEPQGPNRTRAGEKISAPRDLTGRLYSAADRACHRADDYHSRSDDFDAAGAAFASARGDGAAALDAARTALDAAEKTQNGVRERLDHPKPNP